MKLFAPALICLGLCAGAIAADLPGSVKDGDYRTAPEAMLKLGQLLFYDRVLSGTYRVSCATCHNPDRASSNGFPTDHQSTGQVDDGAVNGLPIYDALRPSAKHAPPLFNLGAKEFQTLFGDGRVARLSDGTFLSPAGKDLPNGLRDVLAVQALFPAVTGDELVGTVDNDVKAVAHLGNRAIWDALADRVRDLPDYWPYFQSAYPDIGSARQIDMTHIANAISAFVATEWRSDGSPFDAYMRGDDSALAAAQRRGLSLFNGKARCSSCHGGPFQTDHQFHAVATPLWRFDADLGMSGQEMHRDRFALTGDEQDRFRRRTPSLRNVARTAPYGHAGSFATLPDMLRAHLDPQAGLDIYFRQRPEGTPVPSEVLAIANKLLERNELDPVTLSRQEFDDLLEFLNSLTDERSLSGRLGRPTEVPSFLALD